MEKVLFTSESVSEGHPDKIADQISDAVLDAMLKGDPNSRVACESLVTTGMAMVSGEVTSKTIVDVPSVVRDTIRKIGYTSSDMGFDADSCAVMVTLDKQSPDISQGVTAGQGLHKEQGAGDQGMMFGYACNETPAFMPLPVHLSHRLVQELARLRKNGKLKYLYPDSKSQVTVEYAQGKPKRIQGVVVSTQHAASAKHAQIQRDVINKVIKPICGKYLDNKTKIYINPTGRFVIGGPHGDCGLTGPTILGDTNGGLGRHGGGAFSGKDPSKVDRSAAYAARYIAKNLVAARAAAKCEVQLAYAIGVAEPVSVLVDTFGTSKYSDETLEKIIRELFPLKPADIISRLRLKKVKYSDTAAYGHFGRNGASFTWEKTDKVTAVKRALAKIK